MAQLNGLDDAKHSEFFGTFIHDNAIPITLSGDELGRFGALLKGFKFKAPKMPVFRGFKLNTKGLTRGFSKVGKEVQKGAKNYVKAHQKAFKDISKGAGKIVGQVAEGGMGLLQSMGQQGQEQAEELDETQNYEDSSYPEENYSEGPEEIPTDEYIEEDENLEEVNGELGFLPQAMMAAGTAGQLFNSFNSMQQSNTAAKHARSMDKLNAFASILRPQQTKTAPKKKPAPKKAVSNSSFANPKLAQTPEGALKLSYSNRNLDNTTDSGGGSADKKDDNKNIMYIGAGIAALGLVFIMNKKGR
ncbi:hypothetical protein LEP1GSC166_2641 [Leptospira kirschneri]|nr:hypothetical protein LEP1GSC166_2641 [Leptospira kirschneri]